MSLLLFLFFFTLYLLTSQTLVSLGDGGGFSAAAFSLGLAHPPGYFLYALLGKAFGFLPFGNVAGRMSILSGLYSSLAAVLIYKTLLKITGDRVASAFAVSAVFLSALIWGQSVIPEVYTLNLLISSAVLYLAITSLLEPAGTFRGLLFMSFLIGLGTANHHTVLLMGTAVVFVFFANRRHAGDRLRALAYSFIFFTAGFMCNLGIILRGLKDILYNHSPASNAELFLAILFRKHYEGDTLSALGSTVHASTWVNGIFNSLSFVFSDTWYFIPVLTVGLVYLFRKNRKVFSLTCLIALLWAGIMGSISAAPKELNPEHKFVVEVFFLPLYLPMAVLLGSGLHALKSLLPERERLLRGLLPVAIALLPVIIMLPRNYPRANQSENWFGYQYGRDLLSVLPPRSILVVDGDNPAFTTNYLEAVERYREDVILTGYTNPGRWFFLTVDRRVATPHPLYPDFFARGWWVSAVNLKKIMAEGFRPFFVSSGLRLPREDFKLVFYGPVYMVTPEARVTETIAALKDILPFIMDMTNYERLLDIPDPSKDYFSWTLSFIYSDILINYGNILAKGADKEAARQFYEAAYRLTPIHEGARRWHENFMKSEAEPPAE